MVKLSELTDDPDFFNIAKTEIETEISNLMKIIDQVSQMRVQASLVTSDMMLTIDSRTWQDISALIGLTKTDLSDAEFKE
ncbi:unnamed protein product [Euphydryas editha]|uniref:Uncharacterized protein n=1 Tax=Euphydryas editha TaxID=104508 RepID=A0AAU9UFT4_EUPED|nr:unnamed protein product [Euphydryas editha]